MRGSFPLRGIFFHRQPTPTAGVALSYLHPELGELLKRLGGTISEVEMRRMNFAVDGEHRDVKQVVAQFLREKGL